VGAAVVAGVEKGITINLRCVLGGFNRSSQHPDLGGVDDDGKKEVGALDKA
jgi:hypothetical protein